MWFVFIFCQFVKRIRQSLTSDKMTGTLCKEMCSFMLVSRRVILKTRNVSDEICKKRGKTFYVQKLIFPQNLNVHEIMWENIAQPDRPRVTT